MDDEKISELIENDIEYSGALDDDQSKGRALIRLFLNHNKLYDFLLKIVHNEESSKAYKDTSIVKKHKQEFMEILAKLNDLNFKLIVEDEALDDAQWLPDKKGELQLVKNDEKEEFLKNR
eukprot:UN05385